MSYPHLSPEAANECSQAVYGYSPDCYCAIHWVCADYLPRLQYHNIPAKWLEAYVWRSGERGEADRFVTFAYADNGPDLLRNLRTSLAALASGQRPDPSLPTPEPPLRPLRQPYTPPAGNGWIATAPQTTQELNPWPH